MVASSLTEAGSSSAERQSKTLPCLLTLTAVYGWRAGWRHAELTGAMRFVGWTLTQGTVPMPAVVLLRRLASASSSTSSQPATDSTSGEAMAVDAHARMVTWLTTPVVTTAGEAAGGWMGGWVAETLTQACHRPC